MQCAVFCQGLHFQSGKKVICGEEKKGFENTGVVPGVDVDILLFALRDHLHPEGA